MNRYLVCLVGASDEYTIDANTHIDAIAHAMDKKRADDAAKGIIPEKRRGRKPNPVRYCKLVRSLD